MSSASLKKLAIRGAAWTIFGYGTSQILRFGSNLILTRLLVPELFGLMALVQVFINGLALFSDIGIRPSIIQNKRGDDPEFLNTAWTLQVIRGFGLWGGCLLIALPVAKFYGEPRLLWLIPVVGLNTIISGFNSTSLASLSRHMEIGKLMRFELGMQIISLSVLIVWACLSPTIWALVGGNLVSIFIKVLWSHRLNPETFNRFAWDKDAIKELFSFGRWIFVSTAMTFLAAQADRLILGKLFTFEMLGVYSIAFNLSNIPRQLVQKLGMSVIFPMVSQRVDLPRGELRAKIKKQRWRLLIILAIIVATIASIGDLLILGLYDERYADAAWMLPLMALGIWPIVLSETLGRCLNAIGKPLYGAYGSLFRFLFIVIGLPLGFFQFGVVGAIAIVSLSYLPTYITLCYGLWHEGLLCIEQDIQVTALFFGLLTLALILRDILGFEFTFVGTW